MSYNKSPGILGEIIKGALELSDGQEDTKIITFKRNSKDCPRLLRGGQGKSTAAFTENGQVILQCEHPVLGDYDSGRDISNRTLGGALWPSQQVYAILERRKRQITEQWKKGALEVKQRKNAQISTLVAMPLLNEAPVTGGQASATARVA